MSLPSTWHDNTADMWPSKGRGQMIVNSKWEYNLWSGRSLNIFLCGATCGALLCVKILRWESGWCPSMPMMSISMISILEAVSPNTGLPIESKGYHTWWVKKLTSMRSIPHCNFYELEELPPVYVFDMIMILIQFHGHLKANTPEIVHFSHLHRVQRTIKS